MVRHIVTWRLRPGRTADDIGPMKAALEGLVGVIDGLRRLEVGLDLEAPAETRGTVVLYSEFDTMDAVRAYIVHPRHAAAAALVPEVCTDRRASDHLAESASGR